jgi:hypothetical protein
MEIKLHTVLISGEWSASHSGHFLHGERIGGCVGHRARLDVVAKRITAPTRNEYLSA